MIHFSDVAAKRKFLFHECKPFVHCVHIYYNIYIYIQVKIQYSMDILDYIVP